MPIRVSIITPTWNRAALLSDVWECLKSQTCRDFEWVIADDGSTDPTLQLVHEMSHSSPFNITLVTASHRVGKATIDNEAVKASVGEFVLWCDSDDLLHRTAIQTLIGLWDSIDVDHRGRYFAVTALCETKEGILGEAIPTVSPVDLPWNGLYHALKADHLICIRGDLVRNNPFPQVDFVIPESSVWHTLGNKLTRFLAVPLLTKRYNQVNCITDSGIMEYNFGKAVGISKSASFAFKHRSLPVHLLELLKYDRYCIHADIGLTGALRMWSSRPFSRFWIVALWPVARVIALRDQRQGKVRKTHREFDTNIATATFTVKKLVSRESRLAGPAV